MNLLINVKNGSILAEHHGKPGWLDDRVGPFQQSGEAVWVEVPSDCAREDVIVKMVPDLHIEENKGQRSKREAEVIAKAQKKAALDAIDPSKKLSDDDLDVAVRAWLEEKKPKA